MEKLLSAVRFTQWLKGDGLDIGYGGRPCCESAICIDQWKQAPNGAWTHLTGDATVLRWFRDGVLDYVFSSHCLEDIVDTKSALREWCRVLKPGGFLLLTCPNEQAYRAFAGDARNLAHKHENFSLEFVLSKLPSFMRILHKQYPVIRDAQYPIPAGTDFNFDIVAQKP